MAQTWRDLLFAHWPVEPAAIDEHVPRELAIETWGGQAWIGITPFEVRALRARMTLPLPLVSRFPEINVRTYVSYDGMPGIHFFSLDAGHRSAVMAARRLYRLPYFQATMAIQRGDEGWIDYRSDRVQAADEAGAAAAFHGRYRPAGPAAEPEPGTFAHWLTERYCLYTATEAGIGRAEIHHLPWVLQPAEAEIDTLTMTVPLGVELTGPPELHYAARQDVLFWPLRPA